MRAWHDVHVLNLLANALLAATTLGASGAGLWFVSQRPAFSLDNVHIAAIDEHALRHVSPALLRSTVARDVQGNFFTIDLDDVRAVFEAVPWVRHASVRRVWPDGLEVSIEEHRALALWGDGRLVNTFGELFTANLGEAEEDAALPQFSGPDGSASQVARRYGQLRTAIAPLQVQPEMLALSPRYAWTVRLGDGTTLLLGRDQGMPLDRRVARWVDAYPHVMATLNRRAEVIDLRYPDGFAIRSLAQLESSDEPDAVRKTAHTVRR